MRFRHILASLVAAGALVPSAAFAQGMPKTRGTTARNVSNESQAVPKILATNQKAFTIPVTIDRAQTTHVPAEVQLLVSADQGKTWSVYARQGAEATGFPFQTRDDGEYWFASRTIDKQGNMKPAGVVIPELKLVIDATPPKIELDAAAGGTGDIRAAFRVTDDTLDPVGIQVEYQASDVLQLNWKKIPLEESRLQTTGNLVTGEVAFAPNLSGRTIDVRLIARDRAGNIHSESRRVMVPRVAKANPLAPEWPPRVTLNSKTEPTTSPTTISPDPFTARMGAPSATLPNAKPPASESAPPTVAANPPTGEIWPADNGQAGKTSSPTSNALAQTPLERAVGELAPRVREGVPAQPVGNGPKEPLLWPSDAASVTPNSSTTSIPEATTNTSPPYDIVPKGTAIAPLPNEAASSAPQAMSNIASSKLPEEAKPLLSPSKSFALEYDLDSVGPAGVKAVELWVTTDNGNTWRKWGEDADKKSPFEIQVETERVFGFRMVIVANNGLATRPPEPGDVADVWVQVDTIKPTVRIMQAGYGSGEHAGQLDIRWQADDEHLGSRPVTIVFSDSPAGPYTTLAAGLPNTGQYYWTIDPRTPRQLYLRVEVRDEAGNLGVDQTAEPVSLEGLAPRGRIRSVAPGGSDQRGAFKTPLFR